MLPLGEHRRSERLRPTVDHAALIFLRTCRQQQVQLFQIPNLRHRYKMVPPELPAFALYTAFLVPFTRCAKLRRKSPVRPECDEPRRLLPLMPTQDFLDCALQVVVAQHPEHSAKI